MSLASWKAGTGPANLRWPCPESSFAGIGDSRDQRRTGARLSKDGLLKGWLMTNRKCIVSSFSDGPERCSTEAVDAIIVHFEDDDDFDQPETTDATHPRP